MSKSALLLRVTSGMIASLNIIESRRRVTLWPRLLISVKGFSKETWAAAQEDLFFPDLLLAI